MTAIAIAKHTRVNPITAWRIERAKSRTGWFILGVVLVAGLGQLLGAYNYLQYKDEAFQTSELAWFALWAQGSVLATSVFLPMVYVFCQATLAAAEFKHRGWQRIVSTDSVGLTVTGKVLHALELAILGMGIYLAETIVTGIFLRLPLGGLLPVLIRASFAVFAAWAIGAAMMLIGVIFNDFTFMATAGLGCTILGLIMTVAGLRLDQFIPFSMITAAMGARTGRPTVGPSEFLTPLVALVWIVVCTVVTRWLIRRREW